MLTKNISNKYDHYYKYEEIKELLEGYASKYSQYAKLNILGKTRENRDLMLLEITDLSTGDFDTKPAFYLEGNLHAGEVTGSMACMYFLDVLFTNIENDEIKNLIKTRTIYVLPRVSPDGAEYYLTTPNMVRSVNFPYPNVENLKGLVPQDLDGDGIIRKMRVKSKNGIWKESKENPNVMILRRPDELEGEFYNVYSEGVINDYDGINIKNAASKYGMDFNRNYPLHWEPEHLQRGAGDYPLCNPETLANATFIRSHKNICAAIDMHTSGGQILYTPGYKSSKEANKADIDLYKKLGQMGHEENGFPVIAVYDEFSYPDDPATYGGFDDFCHFNCGIPCFTIECWDHGARATVEEHYPPREESMEVQYKNALKYNEWIEKMNPGAIKPWTPFKHETLGDVEIGGFDYKFNIQNPPVAYLVEEIEKHVRFYFREIKCLPQISLELTKKEKLADDLYKIEVKISNYGYLSSYVFNESLKLKTMKPISVTISGVKVIEGKEITDIGQLNGFSGIEASYFGGATTYETLPCEKAISWVINTKDSKGISFDVSGAHIGKFSKNIEL